MTDTRWRDAELNQALLRRVHEIAFRKNITWGTGIWDMYPPGLTLPFIQAGISPAEVDIDPNTHDILVLGEDGELYRSMGFSSAPRKV